MFIKDDFVEEREKQYEAKPNRLFKKEARKEPTVMDRRTSKTKKSRAKFKGG